MGGGRYIYVLLSLLGVLWVPCGFTAEKYGMRQLLRQLRPIDGGACNGLIVDSAVVTRPPPPGTSAHFMNRRAMVGCRMIDVSHVWGRARPPRACEGRPGRTPLDNFFDPGGPSRRANDCEPHSPASGPDAGWHMMIRGSGIECMPPLWSCRWMAIDCAGRSKRVHLLLVRAQIGPGTPDETVAALPESGCAVWTRDRAVHSVACPPYRAAARYLPKKEVLEVVRPAPRRKPAFPDRGRGPRGCLELLESRIPRARRAPPRARRRVPRSRPAERYETRVDRVGRVFKTRASAADTRAIRTGDRG